MSDDSTPAAPTRAGAASRHGCLPFFLILLGGVMLLPGLCSLVFVIAFPGDVFSDAGLLLACMVMLAIGIGGGVLIVRARRLRSQTRQAEE